MSITTIQRLGIGGILCTLLIVVGLALDYSQKAITTGEVTTNVFAPIQSDLQKTNQLLSDSGNAFLRFIHRDRITKEDVSDAFGRLVQLEEDLIATMQDRAGSPTLRDRPARQAQAAFDGFVEEEGQDPADDTTIQLKSIVLERLARVRFAARDATQIPQTSPPLKRHIKAYTSLMTSAESMFRRYTLRDRITLNAAMQPVDQANRILDQMPVDVLGNHDHDHHQNVDLTSKSETSVIENVRKALIRYRSSLYSLADAEDSRATGTAFIESRDAAELALYESQIRVTVGTNILGEHLRALQEDALAAGRHHQLAFLILACMTLCLSLAFSVWIGSIIQRRIRLLVSAVKRISAGDFELRVEEQGTDSFGLLATEFNTMARELRAKDEALARRITELDDARRHLHEANEGLELRVVERTADLQMSEQRFSDFANASSDWYWEMDANLRFSYFSDRFTDVTGVDPQMLLGKTREETGIPNVDPEQWQRHLDALHNRRPFRNFIHPRVSPDGETAWLSINGIPNFDQFGIFKGFRGTGNDITELVEAQWHAEQARLEAETASRAKSDFLANMSHELRTPLNAIIGYAELIQEEAEDRNDEVLREDLTKVRNAGKHLLGLINNVLDLSKVEAGKMDVSLDQVDLEVLITEVADTARPLVIEKDNAFQVDNGADVRNLITDSQKLRQTLLNLLSNAAKFTRAGEVRLSVCQDGQDWLRFEVSDTGVGMTEDQMSKVLEPFTQAGSSVAQKYGGTGLGLAITKRFVEILGGQLDMESELGQGSRFTISLPIHQVDATGATALTA